jgi:hypothetical protein
VRWFVLVAIALGCSAAAPDPVPPPARESARPAPAPGPEPGEHPAEAASVAATLDPFGAGYPRPRSVASFGRVGSLTWGTWIKPKPSWGALPLGGIRPGATLPLASAERVRGLGECNEWVTVERGWVCATRRATLNESAAWLEANRWTEPAPGTFPYEYALSVGAPMLTRPVPASEFSWRVGDRALARMRGWNEGHDELAEETPIVANGSIPDFLKDGASAPTPWGPARGIHVKHVPAGTMIAYTRAFEAHGEVWVLSTNLTVIPARGLKRFRRSSFRGVELGGDIALPIAWARKHARKRWERTPSGFRELAGELSVRSHIALTGVEARDGKRRFLETREPNVWVEKGEVTVAEAVERPPPEARGGKWIHIRVNRGTLTLYEGARAVFTTLMSPGKEDATPYGRYTVESKHHVTTMTTEMGEPRKFWIADVPWTIYFKRPYAIHGSYWHEDFGERKSGGCVNLSPIDAERVFRWTDPALPEGWNTVQAYGNGGGPFVLVEG